MRMLILFVFALLILLSPSSARVEFNNLQELVDNYNANIEKAPKILKDFLGSQKVDFTMPLINGSTLRWGFETQNAKIINSAQGGIDNPTIEVYATETAIDNVLNAQDSVAAYKNAEKEGQIDIKANNPLLNILLSGLLSNDAAIRFFFGMFA
jgi:hypothetical protein